MMSLAAKLGTTHYSAIMPPESSSESSSQSSLVRHALDYPYARPGGSYLFVNGDVLPLVDFHRDRPGESLVGGAGGDVTLAHHLRIAGIDPAVLDQPRQAVIASGSNAAPAQLARKFANFPHAVVIPVLRASLADFIPVYAAHITRYGAVPATLQHVPGTVAEVFVTWLTEPQLARMHETEALGRNYGFARLTGLSLACPDGIIDTGFAYIALRGNLHVDGQHVTLAGTTAPSPPALHMASQRQAQALVRDLLAPAAPLHGFIAENIQDAALRSRRIRLLRAFSFPFSGPSHRFEHGPSARVGDKFSTDAR